MLQPIIQILIIRQAAEQGHRQMGMAIDQPWYHGASMGINAMRRHEECLNGQTLTHSNDPACTDGNSPIGDHGTPGIHGDDDSAGDDGVNRLRITHDLAHPLTLHKPYRV
ncbi:MAG: hypothetical protein ACK5UG_13305 [Synechococcaceae cyanobacterium]